MAPVQAIRTAATALLTLVLASGAVRAAETVESLRYGVSLYHLYQGDYFQSLTELMVGQAQEELGPHTENAELLRGGISLSYGMDREAERVFTALLSEPREGVNRQRAWFYLAKVAWQRSEIERAAIALDRAGLALVDIDRRDELAQEAAYLRAAIALSQGDLAAARSSLAALPEKSPWRFYSSYNLGAAHAAEGDWVAAAGHFHQLGKAEATPELRTLRDRAFTASGYALMAAGEFDAAREDFRQVRLLSPVADRALLGHGWAAFENGDAMAALAPWRELGTRPPLSQSVRESLLAVPYAYEQLSRPGLALASYQQARQVYQAELDSVQAAIEQFASGELSELLQLEVENSDDWLFGEDILPISDQAPYLRHLIASHAFQGAMRELRDLQRINRNLVIATDKLAVLAQADIEQQANWERVIEGGARQEYEERLSQLAVESEDLESRLAAAEREGDGRALADQAGRQLWRRLERAESLAGQIDAPQAQRELLRLYRGLMTWDDSEQFPDRRWRAERELAELQAALTEAEQGLARLDIAIANRRSSNFAPRLVALDTRVSEQQMVVGQALLRSESGLRQVAMAELAQQARALKRSLGQSQLAIARLYDRGSTGVGR